MNMSEELRLEWEALKARYPGPLPPVSEFSIELTSGNGATRTRTIVDTSKGQCVVDIGFRHTDDPEINAQATEALRRRVWYVVELARLGDWETLEECYFPDVCHWLRDEI